MAAKGGRVPDKLESMDQTQLECERLRYKIRALRSPLRHNPAHWISVMTAVLAIFATFQQYRLSKAEFLLAEVKANEAKHAQAEADAAVKKSKRELAETNGQLAVSKRELNETRGELALARSEVIKARSLVARLKPTAPPTLRDDIDDFEAMRRRYDPSGRFPYHVPQM